MSRMDEIRARADEAQRTHDLLFNSRGGGGPYGRQNWLSAAVKSSQDIPWLLERLEAVRELHQLATFVINGVTQVRCSQCRDPRVPCPTIEALEVSRG